MALTAAGLGATAMLAFRPQGPPGSQHDAPRGAGSGLRVWGSRQGGLQAGSPHAVQGRPSSQDAATPSHPAGTVMMTTAVTASCAPRQPSAAPSGCHLSAGPPMTNPRVECQFFPPFNRVTSGIGTQPLGQNLCSHALPPSLTQCQAGGRRTRARGTPDCVAHPRIAEPGSKGSSWREHSGAQSPDPRASSAKRSVWTCPWALKQTPGVASARPLSHGSNPPWVYPETSLGAERAFVSTKR